jgi:hypothetical protein
MIRASGTSASIKVSVADITLTSNCEEQELSFYAIEVKNAIFTLRRATIQPAGRGNFFVAIMQRPESGGVDIRDSRILGTIWAHGNFAYLRGNTIAGSGIEEGPPRLNIGDNTEVTVSNSSVFGGEDGDIIWNSGNLRVDDSAIYYEYNGCGIDNWNQGQAVIAHSKIDGRGGVALCNSGKMHVYFSVLTTVPDALNTLITGSGEIAVSHSIIADGEVNVSPGMIKCAFVADGDANELDSSCQPIP